MAKTTKKAAPAPAPAPAPAAVETNAPVVAEAAAETKTSVEPVQLTIADLQLLARIVDLASRRGAFQAPELSLVGDAYNKLAGFLAYVEGAQKAEADAATTTDAAAPAAAE
jgi:hypothetical protein